MQPLMGPFYIRIAITLVVFFGFTLPFWTEGLWMILVFVPFALCVAALLLTHFDRNPKYIVACGNIASSIFLLFLTAYIFVLAKLSANFVYVEYHIVFIVFAVLISLSVWSKLGFANSVKNHQEWIILNGLILMPPKKSSVHKRTTTLIVGSGADELEKYAKLRDAGIIDQEEFEAVKRKLL